MINKLDYCFAEEKFDFTTQIRFFIFIMSSAFTLSDKKVDMEPVMTRLKAIDTVFANSLYFASRVLARQVDKLAIETWKPSGLPPAQGYLLLHILKDHLSFPYFLSRRLLLSPGAVTHLVNRLEEKELVWRYTEKHWTYIQSTQKALDLKPTLVQCEQALIDRCEALLGVDAGALTSLMNQAADKLYEAREKR
jgi:DNA-binding MarR family transcriptional regulator